MEGLRSGTRETVLISGEKFARRRRDAVKRQPLFFSSVTLGDTFRSIFAKLHVVVVFNTMSIFNSAFCGSARDESIGKFELGQKKRGGGNECNNCACIPSKAC